MCCIIHRLKDSKEISSSNLEKIIKKNPDGWGISYFDDEGKLIVVKSMDMTLAFNKIREIENQNKEFLFHVRRATHGKKDEKNCHPYEIHNGVMFHNGTMKKIKLWRKDMSDTWHLTKKIIKCQKRNTSLEKIIEKFSHFIEDSRLAFMFSDQTIVKHGKWHKIDDCFFSKIDWQTDDFWDWTSTNNNRRQVNSNIWSRSFGNNDNTVKTVSSSEKLSFEKLSAIVDRVEKGDIRDEDIEILPVEEIQILLENYTKNMSEYFYNLIQRSMD